MMSRNQRAKLAQETLDILKTGFYQTAAGNSVPLADQQAQSVAGTVVYRPDGWKRVLRKVDQTFLEVPPLVETKIEVTQETTMEAAQRVIQREQAAHVAALNFASAKNPGGGFLNGSQAQEECLARSSGLYPTLTTTMEMYQHNQLFGSLLYSEYLMYSPNVPFFRDDEGRLLENPYLLSIITAPAPNAGAIQQNQPKSVAKIQEVMFGRMENILAVAFLQGQTTLILGAWGCGVFRNDPKIVATLFAKHLLTGGKFQNRFERVVFAVYATPKEQHNFLTFQSVFGK